MGSVSPEGARYSRAQTAPVFAGSINSTRSARRAPRGTARQA